MGKRVSGWSLESVPDVQGLASYRPATLQTGSKQASRSAHSLTDTVTQFCYAMAFSPHKKGLRIIKIKCHVDVLH